MLLTSLQVWVRVPIFMLPQLLPFATITPSYYIGLSGYLSGLPLILEVPLRQTFLMPTGQALRASLSSCAL